MSYQQEALAWGTIFHKHLDICKRCREYPFSLCETGNKILLQLPQEEISKKLVKKYKESLQRVEDKKKK